MPVFSTFTIVLPGLSLDIFIYNYSIHENLIDYILINVSKIKTVTTDFIIDGYCFKVNYLLYEEIL